jgi:hypothetical protein
MQIRDGAYTDMITIINAARKSGMTDAAIASTLHASHVSKADIGYMLHGKIPPWQQSKSSLTFAIQKAQALFDKETIKEFQKRYGKVREYQSEDRSSAGGASR